MKVRSFYDRVPIDSEVFHGQSVTVPDQAISVRDILHNYTVSGQSLPPSDWPDQDINDPSPVFDDLVDAQDAISEGQSAYAAAAAAASSAASSPGSSDPDPSSSSADPSSSTPDE